VPKTKRRPPRRRANPDGDSALPTIGAGLAGLGLLWLGRRIFSGPAPAVVHQPVQLPPRPTLPGPAAPPPMAGMHVDRNGILTVPLPEESAARSRSVRRAPPPPEPPASSKRQQTTDEGIEREADQGEPDYGDEGGGRLGGEKF
jgi:hypothetical protein